MSFSALCDLKNTFFSKKNQNFFFEKNFFFQIFPIVVPWIFLSLRYGADLGRSRLVWYTLSLFKKCPTITVTSFLSSLSICLNCLNFHRPSSPRHKVYLRGSPTWKFLLKLRDCMIWSKGPFFKLKYSPNFYLNYETACLIKGSPLVFYWNFHQRVRQREKPFWV